MKAQEEPYRVEVAGPARRDLQGLSGKIAAAIIEFITGPLAENPQRLSKALRSELASYRSARRGDYRVLIPHRRREPHIVIAADSHRAHIYRRR